jgi:hypothetical protein
MEAEAPAPLVRDDRNAATATPEYASLGERIVCTSQTAPPAFSDDAVDSPTRRTSPAMPETSTLSALLPPTRPAVRPHSKLIGQLGLIEADAAMWKAMVYRQTSALINDLETRASDRDNILPPSATFTIPRPAPGCGLIASHQSMPACLSVMDQDRTHGRPHVYVEGLDLVQRSLKQARAMCEERARASDSQPRVAVRAPAGPPGPEAAPGKGKSSNAKKRRKRKERASQAVEDVEGG